MWCNIEMIWHFNCLPNVWCFYYDKLETVFANPLGTFLLGFLEASKCHHIIGGKWCNILLYNIILVKDMLNILLFQYAIQTITLNFDTSRLGPT